MNNPKQTERKSSRGFSVFALKLSRRSKKSTRTTASDAESPNPANPLTFTYSRDGDDRVSVTPDGREFYNEKLGVPYEPDSREEQLRKLAETFHKQCDMFDEMIAPRGEPRSGEELRAMQRHAANVKEELNKMITIDERATFRHYIAELGGVNK